MSGSDSHRLFVIPTGRGGGFEASIHGHLLELADPADHRFAPNPHNLLVAAVASPEHKLASPWTAEDEPVFAAGRRKAKGYRNVLRALGEAVAEAKIQVAATNGSHCIRSGTRTRRT